MSDLDAFVRDEQAVAEFLALERVNVSTPSTYIDNLPSVSAKWLALLADRERQLAEAHRAKTFAEEAELRCAAQLDEVAAKLRAVAALRDELADGHLNLAPTRQSLRAVVHDRLDAILGGDK